MHLWSSVLLSPQVGFQQLIFCVMSDLADGFFSNLSHSLFGQIIFNSYFFESKLRFSDTIEGSDYLPVTLIERFQYSLYFLVQ